MSSIKVKKHHGRDDLVGEHPFGDAGQVVFLILFLVIWILDSFVFQFTLQLNDIVPLYIRIVLSGITLLMGFYLARKSIKIVFGTVREKAQLIRESIFNKVRHPMYLGALLFYLGLWFLTLSIAAGFVFICAFLFYNFIAAFEEKNLKKAFVDDYEKYTKEVNRWIPKIKST